jgi:hypothetical protein
VVTKVGYLAKVERWQCPSRAGDTFQLQIAGATPGGAVTAQSSLNGNTLPVISPGNVKTDGTFTLTGTESNSDLGDWTETWLVNGVQIGVELEFEVIDKPTSLDVNSVSVAALSTAACGTATFGIDIDITYQVISNSGQYSTGVLLLPYEDITNNYVNGVHVYNSHNDIGPVSQYSDSTEYTDTDGVFHDVPVGACGSIALTATATQAISIYIGDNNYPVRTNSWTFTGPSAGHGSASNGVDISTSR